MIMQNNQEPAYSDLVTYPGHLNMFLCFSAFKVQELDTSLIYGRPPCPGKTFKRYPMCHNVRYRPYEAIKEL